LNITRRVEETTIVHKIDHICFIKYAIRKRLIPTAGGMFTPFLVGKTIANYNNFCSVLPTI